ncbi:MAG TPA: alpha/beta fold hydrolase [Thermohalobaculum sp.]|nr:alpha/beta fold hydrolase [Thermohalobaculum sp.]
MAQRRGAPAGRLSVLLAGIMLACAPGGPLTPPPGDAPGETVAGAGGHRLALSVWQPEDPQAVIVGVHGFGDYGASTFAAAAGHWAAEGITTYAYDQRGFGRNPSRGFWPGAEALVADLRAVVAGIRAENPCLPLAVVGHSMGGGVALAAAGEGLEADGLVLAAPAIWGGRNLNPLYRLLAWGAAVIAPEKRYTGEGLVEIQASDNRAVLEALGRDPLYLAPPSAREFLGMIRVTDLAHGAAGRVAMPALLLIGAKDEIVPNRTVEKVFARLAGPRQVVRYPDGWHLLFRDLQAPRVWADVADWVKRLPRPACEG